MSDSKPQAYVRCFELLKEANDLQKQIFKQLVILLGRDTAAQTLGNLVSTYVGRWAIGDKKLDVDNDIHRCAQRLGEIMNDFIKCATTVVHEHPSWSGRLTQEVTEFHKINDPLVFQVQ
eukprot:TRINITY_DN7944_c0_g1_i1.p1 TRINITY_DN7944_c0_g1~~TRINITY_DN7944_c0_g1_i1.p1  ORF type:complete len:119 (-),score=9.49 TRINITY_DN7944_c0_g1_i1:21-377(-)